MNFSTVGAATSANSAGNDDEAREICIHYLRDECRYGDSCRRQHDKSAFQWQCKSGTRWENFDSEDNKKIEKIFSGSSCDDFGVMIGRENIQMKFDAMTLSADCPKTEDLRRLSTKSTVAWRSPRLEPFCIKWRWFWTDEHGNWIQYAQKNSTHRPSNVDEAALEVAYEDYLKGHGAETYPFRTNENNYNVNFATMVQQNLKYHTQRKVRRRPKLMKIMASVQRRQLETLSQQRYQDSNHGSRNVPATWDMKGMSDSDEPRLIRLDTSHHHDHSNEYRKVANMFLKTMVKENGTIVAITRVQNFELWQDFATKRERINKKNKRPILEKQLWHGTNHKSSQAICRQNFDFRISGSNVGTLYGQGSYFARDAEFADRFSKPENGRRRMFLVRVLVGSFVAGKKEYKRPPQKNPNDPNGDLYDACVDKESNPSIFVIFDKSQVYPEYLIEYTKSVNQSIPLGPSSVSAGINWQQLQQQQYTSMASQLQLSGVGVKRGSTPSPSSPNSVLAGDNSYSGANQTQWGGPGFMRGSTSSYGNSASISSRNSSLSGYSDPATTYQANDYTAGMSEQEQLDAVMRISIETGASNSSPNSSSLGSSKPSIGYQGAVTSPKSTSSGYSKPSPKSTSSGSSKPSPKSTSSGYCKPSIEYQAYDYDTYTAGISEQEQLDAAITRSVRTGASNSSPNPTSSGYSKPSIDYQAYDDDTFAAGISKHEQLDAPTTKSVRTGVFRGGAVTSSPNSTSSGYSKPSIGYQAFVDDTYTAGMSEQEQLDAALRISMEKGCVSIGSTDPLSPTKRLTPEQQAMVQLFSHDSKMKEEWSLKCLQDNNWDFLEASTVFMQLKQNGSIPMEAFMKH